MSAHVRVLDLSPNVSDEMPEDWKRIGFSGFFTRASELTGTENERAAYLASLPQFAKNSNSVMVLREFHGLGKPAVLLVWKDAGALMAAMTTRGVR